MALGPCRECGKQVSMAAKVCPSCGIEYPAGKPAIDSGFGANALSCVGCLVTAIVVVIVIMILGKLIG